MAPIQIGDTVLYALSQEDAQDINRRYEHAAANRETFKEHSWGYQVHIGTCVSAGEIVAIIITKVWTDDSINGKALLDGTDNLWVTSAPRDTHDHGLTSGHWRRRQTRFVQ